MRSGTDIAVSHDIRQPVLRPARVVSLGQRALRGLVMVLAQNAVGRVCSLASQLALAALLLPADFGLIGLTYGVTTIVATLTSIGVEDVILQRKRTLYLWSGAAFWINLGLASAGGLAILLLAPVAASVYRQPQLIGLMAVLAASMPLAALSSVPGLIMRAQMQFGTVALYGSLELIGTALATVGLAWAGFGAYSFVVPTPLMSVIRAAVYWYIIDAKPRLRANRGRWKYLVRNTAASFASKTIVALIGQGDYMVLGLLASQSVVGRYYFGFRLAAQPLWVLAGNLAGILYPTLIQLSAEPERQGRAAFDATKVLSFCVMPLALIQAAVVGPALSTFFGQKWAASIPIIQILSIGLALDAMSWVAGALLAARGEFVLGLRYIMYQLPLFFVLVTAGALLDQAVGVAWAVCIFYALSQPLFVYGVYSRVGVGMGQVAWMYLMPSLYAAVAVGAGLALSWVPALAGLDLVRVLLIGSIGVGVYALLVRTLAHDVWSQIVGRFSRVFERAG